MERKNNYLIQAQQAKLRFLSYDQDTIIREHGLTADDEFLYLSVFSFPYRLHRKNGDLERFRDGTWRDANHHSDIMTILDLLCDAKPQRCPSGKMQNMAAFGQGFHQSLLEEADPLALAIQNAPEKFRAFCEALGAVSFPQGDIAYQIPLFEGLSVVMQLWLGDEEFPPNLRLLWDANTTDYIRYETMYFARNLLTDELAEALER